MPLGPLAIMGIASGASMLGNIVGGLIGKKNQEKQQDQAMSNWYAQQEYNSPLNQRKRLEAANLSPSLMYQSMPQNVAESPAEVIKGNPMGEALQKGIAGASNQFMQYMALKQQEANINAVNAETRLKDQQYNFNELNNPFMAGVNKAEMGIRNLKVTTQELENLSREINLKYQDSQLSEQLKSIQQNNTKLAKEISYMDENQRNLVKEKLASIALMVENAKLSQTQQKLNLTNSAVASWEALARSQGWSYSDNILFREVKGTLNSYLSDIKSGKANQTTSTYVKLLQVIQSMIK